MGVVRQWTRWARRRPLAACALLACALAALAASARVLAPPRVERQLEFPRARAAHVAHLLADVSAHTLTIPGSWTLEDEAGNYTMWRYAVSYACGPRCAGRTAVEAHERAPQPRHGLARAHLVRVTSTHCTRPPLLPWPLFCDEMETVSVVTSIGGDGDGTEGARLQQTVHGRCGAVAALLARCAGADELRRAADALLLRVRDKLHNRDYVHA